MPSQPHDPTARTVGGLTNPLRSAVVSTVGAPDRIRGRAVEPTTLARRCTSILLTIALLAIPGAAAEATEVPDPEAEPPESLVEYFQEFRETAGFPSSRDLVVRSMTDASYSQDEFGVPLQLEEADEIHRRIEVQGMVDPSFVWSDSLEGAAGTYMDQGAGGVPTFLTTKDPHDIADLVAAHVPQGIDYRITQVEFSTEQLRAAKATIIGDFDELRRTGVQARSVALDVIRNRALVGVQALDAAAEQILRSRYGSIVSMREEPVRNLDHSTYSPRLRFPYHLSAAQRRNQDLPHKRQRRNLHGGIHRQASWDLYSAGAHCRALYRPQRRHRCGLVPPRCSIWHGTDRDLGDGIRCRRGTDFSHCSRRGQPRLRIGRE